MFIKYINLLFAFSAIPHFAEGALKFDTCKTKPCGTNAICVDTEDNRYCKCKCGYYGDPEKACIFIKPENVTRGEAGVLVDIVLPDYLTDKEIIDGLYEIGYPAAEVLLDNIDEYYSYSFFLSRIRYFLNKLLIQHNP